MIFRMIGGKVIPMPNLFDKDKRRSEDGLLSPLSMEYAKKNIKELIFKPDAKCPQCGCLVWRCVSVRGDVILLDLLGPPWPSHNCLAGDIPLSGYQQQKNCQITSKKFSSKISFDWFSQGWRPVFDVSLQPSVDKEIMKIHFYIRDKRAILKVEKRDILSNWVSTESASERAYGSICFIRARKENGFFDLSLMDSRLNFISVTAFK